MSSWAQSSPPGADDTASAQAPKRRDAAGIRALSKGGISRWKVPRATAGMENLDASSTTRRERGQGRQALGPNAVRRPCHDGGRADKEALNNRGSPTSCPTARTRANTARRCAWRLPTGFGIMSAAPTATDQNLVWRSVWASLRHQDRPRTPRIRAAATLPQADKQSDRGIGRVTAAARPSRWSSTQGRPRRPSSRLPTAAHRAAAPRPEAGGDWGASQPAPVQEYLHQELVNRRSDVEECPGHPASAPGQELPGMRISPMRASPARRGRRRGRSGPGAPRSGAGDCIWPAAPSARPSRS